MRSLCETIKRQTAANFVNLETAIRTYDRDAPVCGVPAWRYVYHTVHSADKWFFDPSAYEEPPFHTEGADDPDRPCGFMLSDGELLRFLNKVREKTEKYLDGLTDEMLYEAPEGCGYTRLELILGQFRHISLHTGMLNGQTIERTGRFPVCVGLEKASFVKLSSGLFE